MRSCPAVEHGGHDRLSGDDLEKFATTPFNYTFLDEAYHALYTSEKLTEKLFIIFSALAVTIACLGLFGLAAFSAEQRTKEIGIRKVLGASISNLISLLSRDFVKLVLLSNVIAWPIAYFVMSAWLQNFAYRVNLGAGVFIFAGCAALVIAILTVSVLAVKAATANPVDALKYE